MIPSEVWGYWIQILTDVITMIMNNVVLSFYFASIIVIMVVNLIVRLSSPKDDGQ